MPPTDRPFPSDTGFLMDAALERASRARLRLTAARARSDDRAAALHAAAAAMHERCAELARELQELRFSGEGEGAQNVRKPGRGPGFRE